MNPFKYGEFASGDGFCNRKPEIKRLHQAFKDGQSVILISPRRWGKSSLVDEALNRYKGNKLMVIKIDCFGKRSADELYLSLLQSTLKSSSSKLQEISNTIKKLLAGITPYISFSTGVADEVKLSFSIPEGKMDADAILDLPQKLAVDKRIRTVVCIDEFQKISEWPESNIILEKLRSHWQKHTNVSYCLYGSQRHLMATMFTNSSQPFYRFGETIFLQKISREEWTSFIMERFAGSGKNITTPLAGLIADKAECHSYYVQYLARLCWNNTDKTVTQAVIDESFENLLNDQVNIFQRITERLTLYQVNYLKAFCQGETKFSSMKVLKDYNLGSSGNIKRIEKVMEDLEIIDYSEGKPFFTDPFFEPLFRKFFISE